MGVLLYRVDERLIHGQVVIGWGGQLRPERYIVVDDALAQSEWEQELYRLGLPEGSTAEFVGREEAVRRLRGWKAEPLRSVLLTRDVASMVSLAEAGLLEGEAVNLGGIHHAPGRTRVRSYLHLDDAERHAVQRLADLGAKVAGRDLPDSKRVGLDVLLKGEAT